MHVVVVLVGLNRIDTIVMLETGGNTTVKGTDIQGQRSDEWLAILVAILGLASCYVDSWLESMGSPGRRMSIHRA